MKVTCFGEILWDVFPTEKKIGGAPLNVALRLHSFGVTANVVSSIGNDDDGKTVLEYLRGSQLDTSNVQINQTHKTGCVAVTLNDQGSATYEIEKPAAWDFIELTENTVETVKVSDAFVFGSLACRNKTSKNTLFKLLEHAKLSIFDVNLRPPFYSMDLLVELMRKSDVIKCNDDEIKEITKSLGFNNESLEDQVRFLASETTTKTICVTKGGEGALLYIDNEFFNNRGYRIEVADTVGAGDSFLASFVFKFLLKENIQESLDFASAVGSLVASKNGANPSILSSDISQLRENQG